MAFRPTTYRQWGRLALLCSTMLLGACSAAVTPAVSAPGAPPDAVTTPAAFAAPIDQAAPALIAAERAASIGQDRALLRRLWSAEARIIDGRGTASSHDDYVWQGWPAVLDRYELAVFPSPPPPLADPALPDATITADGDTAVVEHAGDRWRLLRRDGRWWLDELVYSAPQ